MQRIQNTLSYPMKPFLLHKFRVSVCTGTIMYGLLLAGCSTSDPWTQRDMAPQLPAHAFQPDADILAPARNATEESGMTGNLGKDKMSLAECITVALENNPRTQSTWRTARAAAAGAGEEKAAYLPQAEFSSDILRADSADIGSDASINREEGPTTIYGARFGVRYLLFNGGRRAASVNGAQAQLYAANFRHNTTLQEVALTVEEAYYRLLAAKWSVKAAKETSRQTQSHIELARARKEAGVVSRSDVLKAQTERANARLQLVRAESEVKVARGELASTMNLKVSTPLRIKDIPENTRHHDIAAVEMLLKEAAKDRPELQTALAEVQKIQADVKAARAQYWPELTASTDYGWKDENFAPEEDEWSVGLGLTLPIFSGFERSYRIQQTESELRRAIADYGDTLRTIALEVWTAYARVHEADQAIEAARALTASARESLEVAASEYKAGAGSIIELIDAQTADATARSQLVQARLDWYVALARLERAVGRNLGG